jgi:NADPH:quinone reductase-like Zn-dependent oxidoreductase
MKTGGPEVLKIIDLPEVIASGDEIRIRVHASSINPTDILARNGGHYERQKNFQPPFVPGMDIAGTVDQIGKNANTHVQLGDPVMGMVVPKGSHGAYREQIVLKDKAVVPIPNGVSFIEASTLPMNGLTARLSLDLLALKPGDTIAVTGAAGAYGGYLIQLSKHEGLTVIADASETDYQLVKSLGADVVVPRGDNVANEILKIFPDGVNGLADGAVLNEKVISAVQNSGSFTSVRGYKGTGERDINFTETWVTKYDCQYEKLNSLGKLVNEGKLNLRVADTYDPEDISLAHKRFEAGGTRGRLVIKF